MLVVQLIRIVLLKVPSLALHAQPVQKDLAALVARLICLHALLNLGIMEVTVASQLVLREHTTASL